MTNIFSSVINMNKRIFVIILSIISIASLTISSQAQNINIREIKNDNNPPIIIEDSLNGETEVKDGVEYTYTVQAYDPDGDPIRFLFIWVEEEDPNDPGQYAATYYPEEYVFVDSGPNNIITATVTHTWPSGLFKKDFKVRVVVDDDCDGDGWPNSASEFAEIDITRQ